jgi:3-phosphoshikimate 1-carboxyvinyltransferase
MVLDRRSSDFCTKINLPASKSLSNRWLILNACMEQKATLRNLSNSTDTLLMKELLNNISQHVSTTFNSRNYKSDPKAVELNCKNAGTVLRFLTAYCSATQGRWMILGDKRLTVRPISDLVNALKHLGTEIFYKNQDGQLPLMIFGKPAFHKTHVRLNMGKSSQFASALMLMLPKFPSKLHIDFESELISTPYFEMTAKILEQCGVYVKRSEKSVYLKGIPRPPRTEIFIESDWSAASYFYGLVALSEKGVIEFENLHSQSLQGDSIVAKWFENFGVRTTFTAEKTIIKKVSKPLISALELDFTDYPDLAQTLAVTCAALSIPAKLTGLSSLRNKETDRLQALSEELNRIGAKNTIEQNSLILQKNYYLDFLNPIKTYGDHRMAMAFSVFSGLYNSVQIEDPKVVNKSFPDFWEEINKIR